MSPMEEHHAEKENGQDTRDAQVLSGSVALELGEGEVSSHFHGMLIRCP